MINIALLSAKYQASIVFRRDIKVNLEESLELWTDPLSERRARELLGLPEHSAVKRVGLVVGSSPKWPTKRWPVEFFLELSKRLVRELKCEIVLIGSEGEGVPAELFEKEKKILNLIGKTSLSDLVPLIRHLDVLVTGDTAPLHIAAASQTPVVALFGPTDPKRHMPPAKASAVLVKNLACQPCYQGICKNTEELACLKQISVQEVFQAVQRQITKKEANTRASEPQSEKSDIRVSEKI